MRIIAAIVFEVRYIYSRGVIHRDQRPDNIFLDWNIKIGEFGHSASPDQPKHQVPVDPGGVACWSDVMSRYASPGTYDDVTVPENDVFSFGMILDELILGRSAFQKEIGPLTVACALVQNDWCPDIPDTVVPVTNELIQDCLARDYHNRPSFTDILQRLEAIDFKLMSGVNLMKISEFIPAIEDQERQLRSFNPPISDRW
jgi:serine/threonine protein kinase